MLSSLTTRPFLNPISFSTAIGKTSRRISIALPKLPFHLKRAAASSPPPLQMSSSSQTVEHVVLFTVKPDTDPSKLDAMLSGLRSLTSLTFVLHLTAGPIFRNRSSSFKFTHLLHSRYKTKEDLASYSSHPSHLDVVKSSILPICDDITAVDWIADLDGPIVPRPNSAMRLTLLKLKEPSGDNNKDKCEILSAIGGIKAGFPEIDQISFGENFSPARAKGFTICSISIFPGLNELDGLDDKGEMLEMHKAKVRDLLEDVIVVDYVIPPPTSANL